MANLIMFTILSVAIIAAAVFSVMTKRIMRSVTGLLFVLFGVAGMFFLLDYTFLGAAQLSIYAGGMTMIYIFAIQLVSKRSLQGLKEKVDCKRGLKAALVALVGLVTVIAVQLQYAFVNNFVATSDSETSIDTIGNMLVGSGKYEYVLPFEFISVFLLACIIGGLVVSRNQEED